MSERTPRPTFVIVGASLAGAKAVETLRLDGFDGRIVLLGEEPERPYERPPLSKDYLRDEAPREKVFVHGETFAVEHDVDWRPATRVAAIHPTEHRVEIEGGEQIGYDRLLITTGARPRRLEVPGAELDGIHYLRTLSDADRLRDALGSASRLAVVGAGWIGSEVAASARQLGVDVAIVDPNGTPLERVMGPEVGTVYRDLHAEHGVELHLETSVDALVGHGTVDGLRTTGGEVIAADAVVVGIGVQPRTELAVAAGLTIDNGIAVDEHLQTSSPDIFAAGDVASAWHPLFNRRIRVEHWANALNQGIVAAKNMLGTATPYERIPYFYSDQYDLGMEYAGHSLEWDQVVFRGDPATRTFVAFWLDEGRVVAGMNANVWDINETIQQIVRSQMSVPVDRLIDPDIPLDQLLVSV